MMSSWKIKGFALDSKASGDDVEMARLKHHNLLQDYKELDKEVNAMRSRLETANKRKLVLAAEVRFLRRRRRCLVETNKSHSIQKQSHVHASTPLHQTKSSKKRPIATKAAANKGTLPSSLVANPKKQRKGTQKVAPHLASSPAMNRARKRLFDGAKEPNCQSLTIPTSDLNQRASRLKLNALDLNRKGAATLRNPIVSLDLNLGGTHGAGEPSSLKAPIFDLNEISTGDEELHGNVDLNIQFELESTKSVAKGSFLCRNSGGEGSSRVGKRKISWQDPVALRV